MACCVRATGVYPGRLTTTARLIPIWSINTGGANFLYADGHVAFLTYAVTRSSPGRELRTDGAVDLEAMMSRAGGEIIPD